MIEYILGKSVFDEEDLVALLGIENYSEDYFKLLYRSAEYARKTFGKGYVFAQLGINKAPCSGNCKFCDMAACNCNAAPSAMSEAEVTEFAGKVKGISDFFVMTTADYDREAFLGIMTAVRKSLDGNIRLVANTGDFDYDYALKLKAAGIDACYHIRRLREGVDTDIPPKTREKTIEAIKKSGMELYYCIEPIGREHSAEELAKEIMYASTLGVDVMAVMRRVNVKGTKFGGEEEITLAELTKIAAVTMLAVKPKRSMNVHEPNAMTMLAGVNQLYAEYGHNPRDSADKTEDSRGMSVEGAKKLLRESEWTV